MSRRRIEELTSWRAASLLAQSLWVAGLVLGVVVGLWTGTAVLAGGVLLGEIARRYGRVRGRYARRVLSALRPITRESVQRKAEYAHQQRTSTALSRVRPPADLLDAHAELVRVIQADIASAEGGETNLEEIYRLLRRQDSLAKILNQMSTLAQTADDDRYLIKVTDYVDRLEALRTEARNQHSVRIATALEQLLRIKPPPAQSATHESLIDALSKMAHLQAELWGAIEDGEETAAGAITKSLSAQRDRLAHQLADVYGRGPLRSS